MRISFCVEEDCCNTVATAGAIGRLKQRCPTCEAAQHRKTNRESKARKRRAAGVKPLGPPKPKREPKRRLIPYAGYDSGEDDLSADF